jgi:hypothetical protein
MHSLLVQPVAMLPACRMSFDVCLSVCLSVRPSKLCQSGLATWQSRKTQVDLLLWTPHLRDDEAYRLPGASSLFLIGHAAPHAPNI